MLTRPHNNNWPGERRPSFTATVRIKNLSSSEPRSLPKENRTNRSSSNLLSKKLPLAMSTRTLTLFSKKDPSTSRLLPDKREKEKERREVEKRINMEVSAKLDGADELEDYVVDYVAFNFIGKVIDAPELWTKFVHKKQKD